MNKFDEDMKKMEDEGLLVIVEVPEEPTYGCDACEQIAMSMSNPCQCLSCDPDGTRYICTCNENNKGENDELSSNRIR